MSKKIANFAGNWTRLLKVVLFVIFCFVLGIPQGMYSCATPDEGPAINAFEDPLIYRLSYEESMEIRKITGMYYNSFLEKADSIAKADGFYGPYDYFDHLDQIKCEEERTGVGAQYHINHMVYLHHEGLMSGKFTAEDIDNAQAMNIERYPTADPNRVVEPIDWVPVKKWLWLHYLYAMPLAFLWFLLNLIKFSVNDSWKEDYKLVIRSPLSLLLATILYPLYFAVRIIQEATETQRRAYSEAEIRRGKKKFLTLLSNDEKALVEKLVRERASFKKIRETVSAKQGRIVYRGFFASMCATMLVMTISSVSSKTASAVCGNDNVVVEHQVQGFTDSYEIDIGFGYDHQTLIQGILPDMWLVRVFQNIHVWPPDQPSRLTDGPPDTIFHVPVFGSLFLLFEILNQKIKSHEKSIVFNNGVFLGSYSKSSVRGKSFKRFYF
jgi:hypothetical protein